MTEPELVAVRQAVAAIEAQLDALGRQVVGLRGLLAVAQPDAVKPRLVPTTAPPPAKPCPHDATFLVTSMDGPDDLRCAGCGVRLGAA